MRMHRRMLWALVLCWMSVVVGCDFSDSHDGTRTEQDASPQGSNETGTEVFESDDPRWLKLELLAGDPDDHAFVAVGDAGVQTLDLPR